MAQFEAGITAIYKKRIWIK